MHNNLLIEYRKDIDGLRCIAVISVVLYHLFPEILKGGFLGVDIFFVISGFLISKIIFKNILISKFNFLDFYNRRIKRIFPALILVLIFSTLYGYLVLFPHEFKILNKHSKYALMFISNIIFYREVGYFDVSAELKPLLHLWSLAIEEQFYLVWPLCLWLFYKRYKSFKATAGLILLITLGSYLCFFLMYNKKSMFSFYFTLTRLWELTAGCFVAYLDINREYINELNILNIKFKKFFYKILPYISYICFLFILSSLFFLNNHFTGFRYFILLLIISVCILIFNPGNYFSKIYQFLSTKLLGYIALISYPLYLIHWPIISFIKIVQPEIFKLPCKLVIVSVSMFLACLIYKYIETPIRSSSNKKVTVTLISMCILAIIVFDLLYRDNSNTWLTQKFPETSKIEKAIDEWDYPDKHMLPIKYKEETFYKLGKHKETILFLGDSNIEHYAPRISYLYQKNKNLNKSVVFSTYGGACPILNIGRDKRHQLFIKNAWDFSLNPEITTIVIGGVWSSYLSGNVSNYYYYDVNYRGPLDKEDNLNKAIKQLEFMINTWIEQKKQVFIVLSIPSGEVYAPRSFFKRNLYGRWKFAMQHASKKDWIPINKKSKNILINIAKLTGAKILDPELHLCNKNICITYDIENIPVYKDGSHLRPGYVKKNLNFLDFIIVNP